MAPEETAIRKRWSFSRRLRGIWRVEVQLRINELRGRLLAVDDDDCKVKDGLKRKPTKSIVDAIERCLGEAEAATERESLPRRIHQWWTGNAITAAWGSVHQAEAFMVLVEGSEDVRATLPWLRAWIQSAMEGGWRRDRYEELLADQVEDPGEFDRTVVRQAHKDVIHSNAERYNNLRAFRNNLVLVTAMLLAAVVTLALWHALNPSFLALCTDAGSQDQRCISGPVSESFDVVLVVLLGAIGGLLSIAFGLSETTTPPSRYDPKAWQALLKPVAGAATALAGVVLLQADVVVGPTESASQAMYIGYALLFGFSQQLFTRFVDKRAEALVPTEGEHSGRETPAPPSRAQKPRAGTRRS
jgi:hypothetical protein